MWVILPRPPLGVWLQHSGQGTGAPIHDRILPARWDSDAAARTVKSDAGSPVAPVSLDATAAACYRGKLGVTLGSSR